MLLSCLRVKHDTNYQRRAGGGMGTANFYKRNSKRFMEERLFLRFYRLKAKRRPLVGVLSLNNELFSYYVYDHFREYFAVNWKLTSCSPVVRRTPFGRRTSLLATSTPAAVTASAMSRVPMEPNSLPSSPALDAMVTVSSALIFSARALAAARTSASLASSSARRASKNSMFSW